MAGHDGERGLLLFDGEQDESKERDQVEDVMRWTQYVLEWFILSSLKEAEAYTCYRPDLLVCCRMLFKFLIAPDFIQSLPQIQDLLFIILSFYYKAAIQEVPSEILIWGLTLIFFK